MHLAGTSILIIGDLTKYTEDMSERIASLQKKIFWTMPQFVILNDESKKRLIFMSDFGTGKTSLIRIKAKRLLDEGKEVVIVSFEDRESTAESLLTTLFKAEFGAVVHSLRGSGNSLVAFLLCNYLMVIFKPGSFCQGTNPII